MSSYARKYINIGNQGFLNVRNGIYIDKSELIDRINATLDSIRRITCVSVAALWSIICRENVGSVLR